MTTQNHNDKPFYRVFFRSAFAAITFTVLMAIHSCSIAQVSDSECIAKGKHYVAEMHALTIQGFIEIRHDLRVRLLFRRARSISVEIKKG